MSKDSHIDEALSAWEKRVKPEFATHAQTLLPLVRALSTDDDETYAQLLKEQDPKLRGGLSRAAKGVHRQAQMLEIQHTREQIAAGLRLRAVRGGQETTLGRIGANWPIETDEDNPNWGF